MLTQWLYYSLKPLMPQRLRLGLRRAISPMQRRRAVATWPINEAAGQTPAGWPGWPDGKKFALVLTHDVEGADGLAKCRQLMQLEQSLGFRSSFNFIPEGDEYRVTAAQREELTSQGFEVGVHDLRHDGKLYWRRRVFPENARSINGYLKDWGAQGFRSGFMLHELDWLQQLDISYDTSTFDTDPFEPQPDGMNTIFPFWMARPGGGGYVELPYTLPQDSTLFLVLQESSPEIWKRKLDWIAQKGGMALLNVHPDYLGFGAKSPSATEFPAVWYQEFLEYVNERYAGQCWQVLPRDVAGWYRRTCAPTAPRPGTARAVNGRESRNGSPRELALQGKRAAVILYSYYASDPRPRREAEALQRAGMGVDVFCLQSDAPTSKWRVINGVRIFRLPLKRRRAAKFIYILQYSWFLICAFFFLSIRNFWRRYDVVHVHNMPDFLVFSALLPRLTGARVILDLHDPMPELFCSIYGLPETHWVGRWLRGMERYSIAFADVVLTPNVAFKALFASRSGPPEKIELLMNSPDETIFDPGKFPHLNSGYTTDQTFVLMYHGLIVERHGLDLAIRAVDRLRARIPGLQLHLFGEPTDYSRQMLELVQELGLEEMVFIHGFKSLGEIARSLCQIDLGVVPNRLSPFTSINFPTRIFECLAMRKPVLVPRTRGISDYFTADDMLFFEAGNIEDLAAKIEWAYRHPAELQGLMERGRIVYERHCWNKEENKFLGLVAGLTGSGRVQLPMEPQPKPDQPRLREMADLGSGFRPARPQVAQRRICMVSYSDYQTDNRVIRYAEALTERGDTVDFFGIKRDPRLSAVEMVGAVRVHRIQERFGKTEKGKSGYLWPLLKFWLLACLRLSRPHIHKRYDLIHVHNIPDFLVFAAWLPKLMGVKIILDIHDVVPEFYASKFQLQPDSFGVKALKRVERASARFAHHVIISNHLWHGMIVARSVAAAKCSVFINNVNQRIFYRRQPVRHPDAPVILFPGGLQWHQGLDIAIRAMPKVLAQIPAAQLHFYGDGNMKEELMALTRELGLTETVRFFEPRPVEEIAAVMSQADLGVVPKRADSFGNEAYSTKIMEFMALGVPVVVSSTKIDRYYFNDNVVRFFESGNVGALAEALIEMLQDEPLRQRLTANALDYAEQNGWNVRKGDYLELVDALIERRPMVPAAKAEDGGRKAEDGGAANKEDNKTTGLLTTDYRTKAESEDRETESVRS